DEAMVKAERAIVIMIIIQNDILSYHKENVGAEGGHFPFNLVSVMRTAEPGLSQQAAYDRADELLREQFREYYVARSCVPSWGWEIDKVVHMWFEALERHVKANMNWSFVTERYFGKEAERVRRLRRTVSYD
ncbi:hypothetical protein LTS18_010539, partial [Coniosporium uncinatum]